MLSFSSVYINFSLTELELRFGLVRFSSFHSKNIDFIEKIYSFIEKKYLLNKFYLNIIFSKNNFHFYKISFKYLLFFIIIKIH